MKMNKIMDKLLRDLDIEISNEELVLNDNLNSLLSPGFIEIEGCVLLKGLKEKSNHIQLKDFQDRTGLECFINKIHIEDFFSVKKMSKKELMKQTIGFAYKLNEKLRSNFAYDKFEVFVSSDNNHYIVNFHNIRKGEVWLSKNLDGFNDEGIILFH